MTAGLVVAAGIASLAVAGLGPLRVFGPALAGTVLIAIVVAMTMAPALIAVFGRLLYWPGPSWGRHPAPGPGGVAAGTGRTRAGPGRRSAARVLTTRAVALLVAAACVAGLALAALGVRPMRLGYPLIRALSAGNPAARAEAAADQGFAPGILSPAEVLILRRVVASRTTALGRLQQELSRQPGVAGVVGPADLPAVQRRVHLPTGAASPGRGEAPVGEPGRG